MFDGQVKGVGDRNLEVAGGIVFSRVIPLGKAWVDGKGRVKGKGLATLPAAQKAVVVQYGSLNGPPGLAPAAVLYMPGLVSVTDSLLGT